MTDMIITKDTEKKRLKDFEKIAENWDKLPERAQERVIGMVDMAAMIFLSGTKKAG